MRLEWENKVETEREKDGRKSKMERNPIKDNLRSARADCGMEISINRKGLSFCTFFLK